MVHVTQLARGNCVTGSNPAVPINPYMRFYVESFISSNFIHKFINYKEKIT